MPPPFRALPDGKICDFIDQKVRNDTPEEYVRLDCQRAGRMSTDAEVLDLRVIRAPRHPGVSDAVCEAYSEAASVCLARHHSPPSTPIQVTCADAESVRLLRWASPNDTARRSWRNRDDATRDAAYVVSLAVVERELGLVALSRADTRTGADYYVGRPGLQDLEEAIRLEVSGVDEGDRTEIRRRLKGKVDQAARGHSFLPAYASVVGFREAMVLISSPVEVPRDE